MDRDDFIITVYCLVCEQYQLIRATYPLRRGRFAPALTDQEVITMEICGEYFKQATDQDIFDYFRAHYRAWFPHLTDRTLFVRPSAPLFPHLSQHRAAPALSAAPGAPEPPSVGWSARPPSPPSAAFSR